MNWHCSFLGGRDYYCIPRALHTQGKLAQFYTDFWWREKACASAGFLGQRLNGRYHPELADAPVCDFKVHALRRWILSRLNKTNKYLHHLEAGQAFSKRVARHLPDNAHSGDCFFGYDTAFLESAQTAREMGLKTVLGQVDPAAFEYRIVAEEESLFPEWIDKRLDVPEPYQDRREQEWALADRVMVHSEWTRKALIQQGVSKDKIVIIPPAFEVEATTPTQELDINRPLRVLWVGTLGLRKGIHYFIQALQQVRADNIKVDLVGALQINSSRLAELPDNAHWHGLVPPAEVTRFYQQADVLVLPSLSDGFGLVQIEAQAHGLAVVTTPCVGDVVQDGRTGMIIPPRDGEAIAEAIQRYAQDRDLLRQHQTAAVERAKDFTQARLVKQLQELEYELQAR